MKVSLAVMVLVLVALLVPRPGQAASTAPERPAAAPASLSAGKSFLDHASTNHAEEPSYSVPANFPSPLVPQPQREPEPGAMLACLGLLLFLGRQRKNALAAASP